MYAAGGGVRGIGGRAATEVVEVDTSVAVPVDRRRTRPVSRPRHDHFMKRFLEVAGFLLALFGVAGVVRELTDGWFRLLGVTRFLTENVWFLEGRELFANIVIAALGLVLMIGSDRVAKS